MSDLRARGSWNVVATAPPYSVNTMPENTLQALADHGDISTTIPPDGDDAEQVLERFTQAGIDHYALAADLQREGAASFVKSWDDLLACIAQKSTQLKS